MNRLERLWNTWKSLRSYVHQDGDYTLKPVLEHRKGRVIPSHRWVKVANEEPPRLRVGDDAPEEVKSVAAALEEEYRDILEGRRVFYRDGAARRLVTSGRGYPPVNTPPVVGFKEVSEDDFYRLVETEQTSGFTETHGITLPPAGLWYSYYARGYREDGAANAEHLKGLLKEWLPRWEGHLEQVQVGDTLGHVLNFGWPIEDHMERAHLSTPKLREKFPPGIERSVQKTLVLTPKDPAALPEMAQDLMEYAQEKGYLWMYPDLRVWGTKEPPKGFGAFPALVVPGYNGVYTSIAKAVEAPEEDLARIGGVVQTMYLPAQWEELLGTIKGVRMNEA